MTFLLFVIVLRQQYRYNISVRECKGHKYHGVLEAPQLTLLFNLIHCFFLFILFIISFFLLRSELNQKVSRKNVHVVVCCVSQWSLYSFGLDTRNITLCHFFGNKLYCIFPIVVRSWSIWLIILCM